MKRYRLEIDLLPKGAWNNDFSKTLSKNDWDRLREACYKRANGKCQICGYETSDLDAHEMWKFDVQNKTQTLKDIIGICSKCHGVIHFKNSVRLGFGESAKKHFMKVNNVSEMDFANHLTQAIFDYEERNKIYRWKIVADLEKFGGSGIEIKQSIIPFIKNPYENVDWDKLSFEDTKSLFEIKSNNNLIGAPKIVWIDVNNYQGTIRIKSLFSDKIEWFLDDKKIKTKYNVGGLFNTEFRVKNLIGKQLKFKFTGIGGETMSKTFELLPLGIIHLEDTDEKELYSETY